MTVVASIQALGRARRSRRPSFVRGGGGTKDEAVASRSTRLRPASAGSVEFCDPGSPVRLARAVSVVAGRTVTEPLLGAFSGQRQTRAAAGLYVFACEAVGDDRRAARPPGWSCLVQSRPRTVHPPRRAGTEGVPVGCCRPRGR